MPNWEFSSSFIILRSVWIIQLWITYFSSTSSDGTIFKGRGLFGNIFFSPIQSYIVCPELPPCGVIRDTPLWGFRWCPIHMLAAAKYHSLKLEVTMDLCLWVTGYPITFKHQKVIKRSKKCLELPRLTVLPPRGQYSTKIIRLNFSSTVPKNNAM